jgi:hypothetical protein
VFSGRYPSVLLDPGDQDNVKPRQASVIRGSDTRRESARPIADDGGSGPREGRESGANSQLTAQLGLNRQRITRSHAPTSTPHLPHDTHHGSRSVCAQQGQAMANAKLKFQQTEVRHDHHLFPVPVPCAHPRVTCVCAVPARVLAHAARDGGRRRQRIPPLHQFHRSGT